MCVGVGYVGVCGVCVHVHRLVTVVMSTMSCYGDEHACVSSVLSLFWGSGKSRESFRGENIIIILNELCVCIVCVYVGVGVGMCVVGGYGCGCV